MKKKNLFFTAIIFSCAAAIFSCSVIDFSTEDASITAPAISRNEKDGSITILPTVKKAATYINVFRYEVSSNDKDANIVENTTVNIGQIIPTEYYKDNAISLKDYYTAGDKYYQYYVRYQFSTGYSFSKTTNTFKGCGNGEVILTEAEPSGAIEISYTSSSAILTIEKAGELVNLREIYGSDGDDFFSPMISINNGIHSYLFPLTEATVNGVDCYQVALMSLVPDTFIRKKLKVTALIGQTQDDSIGKSENFDGSDPKYFAKVYNWTKPITNTKLTVDAEEQTYFEIADKNQELDVFDYTEPNSN